MNDSESAGFDNRARPLLSFSDEDLVDQLAALRWKRRMGYLTDWDKLSPESKAGQRQDIRLTLADLKTILSGSNYGDK
jgi:hypothetical protein